MKIFRMLGGVGAAAALCGGAICQGQEPPAALRSKAGAQEVPVRVLAPAADGAMEGNGAGLDAAPETVRPAPALPPRVVRGSLYQQAAVVGPASMVVTDPLNPPPAALAASYIGVPAQQPRKFKKHDLVTVIVREDSDSMTAGKGDSKKQQDFDLALQQFLQMSISSSGLPQVGKVGNPSNLPEIKFKYNNDRKNDATQQRTDKFSARIQAEIIDIKPNGTLMVQATKHIAQDREEQTFLLSGMCRAEDVTVDNTVLSTQLADLSLTKKTDGEVHEGTRSGWLNRIIDKVNPF